MLNAPPPEAPGTYTQAPPEALAKVNAPPPPLVMNRAPPPPQAPPQVLAKVKAPPPTMEQLLAMNQAPPPPHQTDEARGRTKVMWWKNVPTQPKVAQIRRFKEHSLNLEPPPKPKPVAKPKPMPEAEPTGRSPGDPYYATDGVPWLQCTICYVFQPDALTYHLSCKTMSGRECTYGGTQQREAAVARWRQPYWHKVSSECECQGGQPCDACTDYGCSACGREDRCGCEPEDQAHAEEVQLLIRLDMEAAWRRTMRAANHV